MPDSAAHEYDHSWYDCPLCASNWTMSRDQTALWQCVWERIPGWRVGRPDDAAWQGRIDRLEEAVDAFFGFSLCFPRPGKAAPALLLIDGGAVELSADYCLRFVDLPGGGVTATLYRKGKRVTAAWVFRLHVDEPADPRGGNANTE